MQIERDSMGWYLSVDGGTDGGEIVAGECRGPFVQRPVRIQRSEETVSGASGETLCTLMHAFRVGTHSLIVREQFWVSPANGKRVKLLEAFGGEARLEVTTNGVDGRGGVGEGRGTWHRNGHGRADRRSKSRRYAPRH
jgi:hypothetical protein